jgi:hypothetical protein
MLRLGNENNSAVAPTFCLYTFFTLATVVLLNSKMGRNSEWGAEPSAGIIGSGV